MNFGGHTSRHPLDITPEIWFPRLNVQNNHARVSEAFGNWLDRVRESILSGGKAPNTPWVSLLLSRAPTSPQSSISCVAWSD